MKWRLALVAAFVGIVFLGCRKSQAPSTPIIAGSPDSTWVNAPTPIRVFTSVSGNKDVRFIVDLGQSDGKIDTSDVKPSGDTADITPKWTEVGTFNYKVAAFLDEDPTKISGWSETKSIRVLPNNPPESLWFWVPAMVPKMVDQEFLARATDPEGDSIQFYFDFGDGSKEWADKFVASGETLSYTHKYRDTGNFTVKVKARDKKRSECAPESTRITVVAQGRVRWYFSGTVSGDSEPPLASPVVLTLGTDTLIFTYCDDGHFYSIKYGDGRKKSTANSSKPSPEDYIFQGNPAYCDNQAHIIIGSDDGYLYAFGASGLNQAWKWQPDTNEHGWGTPAINGNKIYIVSDAEDTLYYLEDAGSACNRLGAYKLPSGVSGAPVIDRSGYVLVALDNGMLYKMEPNIQSPAWVCTLRYNSALGSPIIGDDGVIYVADDSGYVYAINEDSTKKWEKLVDPAGIAGMVLSPAFLFVATSGGKVVALQPTSGHEEWTRQHTTNEIIGSPLLAVNGSLYFMDDDDNLYAIDQATGSLKWIADCLSQVGGRSGTHRPRRLEEETNPSLAIGPTGDIIVIGNDYTYCVIGSPEGTLMQGAPWPKWQKDEYNTGKK